MHLLLLSNSSTAGRPYLSHAVDDMVRVLGGARRVAFVPYAAVRFPFDEYEARVSAVLAPYGFEVTSVHRSERPVDVIRASDAVLIGGGNTFRLVRMMHANDLMGSIRDRVLHGAPFIGWSAGSNVACPTLCTTNDMPIVEPASFETLNLVPFQINPHYIDAHPDGHMGETREERITEFCALRADVRVVGLREGTALEVHDTRVRLLGSRSARIFEGAQAPFEAGPDDELDYLIKPVS